MNEVVVEHVPGKPNLLIGAYDVATVGYSEQEFFVSGTAAGYAPDSDETADYATRIVVMTPTDPGRFSGTVIVEWLNVSGGIDAPAVWFMAHREIARAGHAYVAVSVQLVGVEGGASLGGADMSLKSQNAERYSALHHPGDAYAYDIYSQAGRLVREHTVEMLGELRPKAVLAVGESQSAMFLTTYVNAVDPAAKVYDGFLVHSRFGPAAPLDGQPALGAMDAVPFARELRVPVFNIITETDLLGGVVGGYHPARQPDWDRLRTWEIAGTAHADNYTIKVGFIDSGSAPLADLVAAYAPTATLMGVELSHCINFAPQHHYVLQSALAHLVDWTRTGEAPPTAPPLDLTDAEPPQVVLDANGVATGGVRTPWVDVPVARTSGVGGTEPVMALLFGSGELFDAETLGRLYPGGADDYVERFTTSLDATIAAGFLLAADRQEIVDLAVAAYPRA